MKLIFNHNPKLITQKRNLKNLLLHHRFILFSTVKFYNQIDGVAMASSLVPALANIFMGFHEPKWLNEYNINKPKLN